MYWASQMMPGWAVAAFVLPAVIILLLALSRAVFLNYEQPLNRKIVELQAQTA